MIEVVDNSLPESVINKFYDEATSKFFPWYLGKDIEKETIINSENNSIIRNDKNTIPTFQFFHKFYGIDDDEQTHSINSKLFDFFNQPIFNFLENYKINKKLRLHKSKLNLLTNIPDIKLSNFYNIPHVDVTLPHISVLLYLNDSDGDTTFFNQRYDGNNIRPSSVSIKQKISPKKNRMVISDGYFHASANPIKSNFRIVYNGVFLINDK